jgi:hypothetical protein
MLTLDKSPSRSNRNGTRATMSNAVSAVSAAIRERGLDGGNVVVVAMESGDVRRRGSWVSEGVSCNGPQLSPAPFRRSLESSRSRGFRWPTETLLPPQDYFWAAVAVAWSVRIDLWRGGAGGGASSGPQAEVAGLPPTLETATQNFSMKAHTSLRRGKQRDAQPQPPPQHRPRLPSRFPRLSGGRADSSPIAKAAYPT